MNFDFVAACTSHLEGMHVQWNARSSKLFSSYEEMLSYSYAHYIELHVVGMPRVNLASRLMKSTKYHNAIITCEG